MPTPPLVQAIAGHRLSIYLVLSTVTLLATVANALRSHSNFYSVAIYLSKSSRSILILANFSFLLALIGGHIVQRIFFGSLRPSEVERLYERLWFFITESLLAFTIFRDEFDIPFAIMFGFLLFVKSFHWLANDRVEWMDQRPYPGPPLLFHVRMSTLFVILWSTDFLMFLVAVENTLAHGVGGMVLFASEYGILMATVTNTISKYLLSAYDFRRAGQRGGETAPPWENKSMWVFYIELATDFLKLTTYLVFFTIIITFYGLPLNIVRDVYITARSFITRLRALHRYQTATRNMDQRYPNATEEEMTAMSDHTCIICREEMALQREGAPAAEGPNMTPKKLPCGHVFHFYCLRSWLERQQSCPTCRRTVLDNDPTQRPIAAGRNDVGGPPIQPAGPRLPQNVPVGVGAQNAPVGAANNALGLMGRIFGIQAPPVRPGNAGPLPNAPTQQGGGIIIQYNIHYPAPAPDGQQQQRSGERHPEALQPAPQFQGFHGPGETWYPWPRGNDPENEVNVEHQASAVHTSAEGEAQDSNISPREAAARAAARRMNSSGATETSSQRSTLSAPTLIPLFDSDFHASYSTLASSSKSSNIPAIPGTPQGVDNSASSWGPISSVVASLSDEQLAVMDRITREAIDERLKVLEGVSTAVYRCIDDLMRMRSALPADGAPNGPVNPDTVLTETAKDAET
ncbi:hypothetical protein D9757_004381 [Collybiopsis confluens]|uniref:RING-type E3 ubiquitin transferase n=1 Tax=Collybiopsis confluens TaxID=2823264 RepID=A0A8H5HU69_9AGAR|nr:hypothetical protein D9757_004381 [Collybiopsis confluens]